MEQRPLVQHPLVDVPNALQVAFLDQGAREKDADFVLSAATEANREARLGGIGAVVTAEWEK